jgi:hypothetical protein
MSHFQVVRNTLKKLAAFSVRLSGKTAGRIRLLVSAHTHQGHR